MLDAKKYIEANGQPIARAPLGMLLSAHAQVTPAAPALTIGQVTLTFEELDARANRRARFLAQQFGAGQDDRIVIAMPNCAAFVETAFAAWKLGAVPCPVSWRMAPKEYAELIELIAPRCVVGLGSHAEAVTRFADFTDEIPVAIDPAALAPASTSIGKIMNSGGSTGRPKLILDPEPSSWGPDKEGRNRPPRIVLFNPGPLYHSAPFAYSTMAIAQGSHVICLEKFDPESWLDAVELHRPSFAYLVPTMMSRIAKLPEARTANADLSSIVTMQHMAAPCPADVKRWWIERLGPEKVIEIYGGTERIGATVINGTQWLERPGSVGQAAAGEEIVIMGPDGNELPRGEIGEIYFRRAVPPGSGYAYIGSDTRIRDDIDSFGDMGWLDADGWLFIADRRTDMIVIGGVNVFPAEIEAALETVPGVLCAAVIGLPDDDMGSRLHAIVELAPDIAFPTDELAFIAPAMQGVGSLKRPRSVEFTRERIRDDAGKMRRSKLRDERIQAGLVTSI